MFDLVVIDEASQCDVASAIPLLYRAKRALIIGDQRQLTHITQLGRAREDSIASKWQIPADKQAEFSFRRRSTFGLAAIRVGEPLLLDLHFRSQPAIIEFSNRYFYGSRLEICTQHKQRASEDEPVLSWKDVTGSAERGANGRSWRNRREASAVVAELGALLPRAHQSGLSVGVVTPYRAQVEEIRHLAREVLGDLADAVSIETAHRFQGDERDIMILSPVVSANMSTRQSQFASDPNLINVALTRARGRLIVVGDHEACLRDESTVIAAFARYVAELEASVFDSPLELALHNALLDRGAVSYPGWLVAGHRLDLAVQPDGVRINVECDGAAFHTDRLVDAERDAAIEVQGWKVLRFSGRQLSRDVGSCADKVMELVEQRIRG
jgi:very-short-patch-repair endonuclease